MGIRATAPVQTVTELGATRPCVWKPLCSQFMCFPRISAAGHFIPLCRLRLATGWGKPQAPPPRPCRGFKNLFTRLLSSGCSEVSAHGVFPHASLRPGPACPCCALSHLLPPRAASSPLPAAFQLEFSVHTQQGPPRPGTGGGRPLPSPRIPRRWVQRPTPRCSRLGEASDRMWEFLGLVSAGAAPTAPKAQPRAARTASRRQVPLGGSRPSGGFGWTQPQPLGDSSRNPTPTTPTELSRLRGLLLPPEASGPWARTPGRPPAHLPLSGAFPAPRPQRPGAQVGWRQHSPELPFWPRLPLVLPRVGPRHRKGRERRRPPLFLCVPRTASVSGLQQGLWGNSLHRRRNR